MAMSDIVISIVGKDVVTTSRNVALVFGKEHKNVLRDIRNLIEGLNEDGDVEGMLDFEHTPQTDIQNGQIYDEYTIKRDGFTLLAMGYTGANARKFKRAYIKQFNAMEEALRNPFGMNSDALNDFIRRCDESVAKGSRHGKGLVTRKAEKKQLSKEKTLILDALQMKLTLELGDK